MDFKPEHAARIEQLEMEMEKMTIKYDDLKNQVIGCLEEIKATVAGGRT
jgi:hypothetical protein